jgi:hypothetical protein
MKIHQLHLCPQNQLPLKKHLLLAHLLRYEAQKILGILTISSIHLNLLFHLIFLETSLAFSESFQIKVKKLTANLHYQQTIPTNLMG